MLVGARPDALPERSAIGLRDLIRAFDRNVAGPVRQLFPSPARKRRTLTDEHVRDGGSAVGPRTHIVERKTAYGAAQKPNLPSVGLPRLTGFEGLRTEAHLGTGAGFTARSDSLRCADVRSVQYQIRYPALRRPRCRTRARRSDGGDFLSQGPRSGQALSRIVRIEIETLISDRPTSLSPEEESATTPGGAGIRLWRPYT
jgi:hypothetical protein